MAILKRLLVGRPLATVEQEHQRIPKTIGLAVFSSDAISSTAYATEEILFVTAVGASSLALGLDTLVPIGIAVAILLAIGKAIDEGLIRPNDTLHVRNHFRSAVDQTPFRISADTDGYPQLHRRCVSSAGPV